MAEITSNEKVTSTLNNLIETCKDGQEGFRAAAEGVSDSQIKSLFNSYSQQRAQCVSELQTLVRRLGGNPEQSGHVSASLHRGWVNLKSALTGKNDKAILGEAEKGEDASLKAYQEALQEPLPPEVRTIIERQFNLIKQARDRVNQMKMKSDRGAVNPNC